MLKCLRLTWLFALLLSIFAFSAWGQTYNTRTTTAGNWNAAATWTNGVCTSGATTLSWPTTSAQPVNICTASKTTTAASTCTGGALTVSAGTLTVTGTLTVASVLVNGGTLTVASGGTLNVTGAVTVSSGTFNPSAGTVVYLGAAQSVAAATYGTLTCSGTGLKTMAGNVTTGNLNLIGSANALVVGNNTLTATGTITQTSSGIITLSTVSPYSSLAFGSTAVGNLGTLLSNASGYNLNNLTVGTGAVTLGAKSVAVNGLLTMGSDITVGANTLTLNGTVTGFSNSNTLIGSATSNLTIGGTGAMGTINFSQTNTTEQSFLNIIVNRATLGTVTFASAHRIVTGGTFQLLNGAVTNTGATTLVGTTTITRVFGSIANAPTSFGTNVNYIYGDGNTTTITTGPELTTSTSQIQNFTVNMNGGVLFLTVPTQVNNTLSLFGFINLSSNTLTLGTNASTPGTLTYTSGALYSGTFRRWFTTTSMPTAMPSSTATAPEFPMGSGVAESRKVWVARSAAFSAGGSIAVTANSVAGVTPICPSFTDAAIVVNQRSNSNWVITGTGFAGSSATISYEMEQGNSTFTTSTTANLRLVENSSIADGANGSVQVANPTATPRVRRTGVPLASYAATNTYYIGGNKPNIAGTATSISSAASGAWNTGATWVGGVVPTVRLMLPSLPAIVLQ